MSYIRSYPVHVSGDVRRGQITGGQQRGMGDYKDTTKPVTRWRRVRRSDGSVVLVPVRTLAGMGDIWSEMKRFQGSAQNERELACVNAANASPHVRAIDGSISSLVSTWHPTGYYRPAEIQTLLDTLATQAEAAGAAVAGAPSSTEGAASTKRSAMDDMITRYQARAGVYQRAVAEARAKGANVIDAPGLKDWVISSMLSFSSAYVTAAVLHCHDTLLDKAARAMAAIGAVAARILGVVYEVGVLAVKAADGALNLAALAVKYGPVLALGLGGYVLYNLVKKRRGG